MFPLKNLARKGLIKTLNVAPVSLFTYFTILDTLAQ